MLTRFADTEYNPKSLTLYTLTLCWYPHGLLMWSYLHSGQQGSPERRLKLGTEGAVDGHDHFHAHDSFIDWCDGCVHDIRHVCCEECYGPRRCPVKLLSLVGQEP